MRLKEVHIIGRICISFWLGRKRSLENGEESC